MFRPCWVEKVGFVSEQSDFPVEVHLDLSDIELCWGPPSEGLPGYQQVLDLGGDAIGSIDGIGTLGDDAGGCSAEISGEQIGAWVARFNNLAMSARAA